MTFSKKGLNSDTVVLCEFFDGRRPCYKITLDLIATELL